MNQINDLAVIGAGVSGLSCGILLLEEGYNVTIYAQEFSPNTTSDIAAAIWTPFHCGPEDKVPGWAINTLTYFKNNIVQDDESGCFPEKLITYFRKQEPDPSWASHVQLKRVDKVDLPKTFVDGYEFESLMMDASVYMPYLTRRFEKLGGRMVKEKITTITSFVKTHPVTVNCAALGSKELFNDHRVFPSRGQVMRISKTLQKDAICYSDTSDELVYVMPRLNDMILGGTAQDNDWRTEVDDKDTERILSSSSLIGPAVSPDSILETKVGLRPCRDEIRLETEHVDGGYIIHNYGHGGGGYTLSWGCAMEVVSLVNNIGNSNDELNSALNSKEQI